jgi:hypothetical protein
MLVLVPFSLLLPFPSLFVAPGFSNLVLLLYLPSVFIFVVVCLLCLVVLLTGDKASIFVAIVMFSILYFLTWELKIPGGILGTWDNALPDNLRILQNGGFNGLEQTAFGPVIFTLIASLTNVFGFTSGLLIFSIVRPVVIGGFSYMVAMRLSDSPRVAGLATVLSIVADPFFISPGDSIYASLPNGIMFFLIATYIMLRAQDIGTKRNQIALVVTVIATTLEYPLASVLLVAEALILHLRTGTHERYDITLPVTFSSIFVGWNVLSGGAAQLIQLWASTLIRGGTSTSVNYHSSELFTHLLSFFGNQPPFLLPFSVMWLSVVFAVGPVVWLWDMFARRGLAAMLCLPMFAVAVPLVVTQGGFAEYRVFFYLGLFLSLGLLTKIRKKKKLFLVVALALMLTTLPTLASTLPQVGFNTSQYSTNYATGNFLGYSPKTAALLTYSGVMSITSAVPASELYAGNLHYSNGTQYVDLVKLFTPGICGPTTCKFVPISSLYFLSVSYQFGPQAAGQLRQVLDSRLSHTSLIYCNDVTQLYW